MYDFISPEKVLNALRWLKANNPLYADIEINLDWLQESITEDSDLFGGLVGQPSTSEENSDSELPTEDTTTTTHRSNLSGKSLPSGTVELFPKISLARLSPYTSAKSTLERVAQENGFAIHNVPYDGNCLFSAVAYQLESAGVCVVDSSELRLLVANHLEDNRAMYCDFLSEPVASRDSYNADTEAPSEEDALIATVADPQLQTQLRWERYIQRLRSGAWGDNIAVQGIADMLSVTVNVLSSQTQTIIPITPSSGTSQLDVYVGLIMQYHYVGLD